MFLKSTLFVLVFAITQFTYSQNATFPDGALSNKILLSSSSNTVAKNLQGDFFAVDTNSDGLIQLSEADQVGWLNVQSAGITSIEGIQQFPNLFHLNIDGNPLAQNLFLPSMPNLTQLSAKDCQLSGVDTMLLPLLSTFDCSNNMISNLSVTSNSQLTSLICNTNSLVDLDVHGLTELTTLQFKLNFMQTITASGCSKLSIIDGFSNYLNMLTLDGCPLITKLALGSNNLKSLDLTTFPLLSFLDVSWNDLAEIDLSSSPMLITLTCNNNEISELNFLNNPILKFVNCASNQLSILDLTQQSQLSAINCNNNLPLTTLLLGNGSNESSINFSGCLNLTYVCGDAPQINFLHIRVNSYGYTNCVVNSSCVLGTTSFRNENKIVLFPNPVKSILEFESEKKVRDITIYDTSGRSLMKVDDNQRRIDVSCLSGGTFFLHYESEDKSCSEKFIKI